jgi:hypothetical protein
MFSFMLENVLFLGQSLPGTGENKDFEIHWKHQSALLQDNWKWTEERFQEFMKAVVIFGHSYEPINYDYFVALKRIAQEDAYGRPPILFLDKEKQVRFRCISRCNEERRKALMDQANQQQEDESND